MHPAYLLVTAILNNGEGKDTVANSVRKLREYSPALRDDVNVTKWLQRYDAATAAAKHKYASELTAEVRDHLRDLGAGVLGARVEAPRSQVGKVAAVVCASVPTEVAPELVRRVQVRVEMAKGVFGSAGDMLKSMASGKVPAKSYLKAAGRILGE